VSDKKYSAKTLLLIKNLPCTLCHTRQRLCRLYSKPLCPALIHCRADLNLTKADAHSTQKKYSLSIEEIGVIGCQQQHDIFEPFGFSGKTSDMDCFTALVETAGFQCLR